MGLLMAMTGGTTPLSVCRWALDSEDDGIRIDCSAGVYGALEEPLNTLRVFMGVRRNNHIRFARSLYAGLDSWTNIAKFDA